MYYVVYEEDNGCYANIIGIYTTEDKVEQVRSSLAAKYTEELYALDPEDSGLDGSPQERNNIFHEYYDLIKVAAIDALNKMEV